ncbi:hypothetical protein LNQ81_05300 [Myroides sp. M-43]|uniref:hypothetical protein n=1 Tax=Myroides oncorhynchi TaxID=2893756 RepID=UPI001E297314|nr:hypothetical protein [Myroides oncorhynchi]MCC9042108.1 hypothetical protein [Myroides oncorhynchi]
MKQTIEQNKRMKASTSDIIETNDVIYTEIHNPKLEAANKLFEELKASGALDRLDKLIEQTRAEKKSQE